jgi:hypothetical protein
MVRTNGGARPAHQPPLFGGRPRVDNARAVDGIDYRFISPTDAGQRAAIVVIRATDPAGQPRGLSAPGTHAGIDAALRVGNIRLLPHLYNTPDQIQHTAASLTGAGH